MYGFSWGILRSVTEARMHDDEKHRFIEEGQYIGVMMVCLLPLLRYAHRAYKVELAPVQTWTSTNSSRINSQGPDSACITRPANRSYLGGCRAQDITLERLLDGQGEQCASMVRYGE